MNIKEQVRNDIMLQMRYHINSGEMEILGAVLTNVLAKVEVEQSPMELATVDNTNDYILELFKMQKAPKLSSKTANYYLDTIKRLVDYSGKVLTKMSSMDIESFLNSLRKTNTEVSLNNQRRNISSFYTWMRKVHLVTENPCEAVEAYKEVRKPIDHMEAEEYETLKNGCKNKRDRAMIEVLRCTAVRVGELESLNISDIEWKTGKVTVYGEKSRSYRTVFLDAVAMKYLEDYIQSRGIQGCRMEPLFASLRKENGQSKRLSREGIRGAIHRIAAESGLNRRVYPHLFRKSTASNIVKRGGSVYDAGHYLGHKDRTATGQFYAAVGIEYTQEVFQKRVAMV